MTALPPSPRSSTAAALAVLGDPSLVTHIAQFQRGLPLFFQQLRRDYVATRPPQGPSPFGINPAFTTSGLLWRAVVTNGELRHVQSLYRMRSLPEVHNAKFSETKGLAELAVSCGRVDVLQWLHAIDREATWSGDLLYQASDANHPETAHWLMANRPEACVDGRHNAMACAAVHGELELLKVMIHRWPEALTPYVMDTAAWGGNLEVITYLHEETNVTCTTDAMDRAALRGHVDVVRFLHENRTEGCTTKALDNAASCGSLETVRFLHEHRTEGCTTRAMDYAADVSLELVKFFHEHRTEGCTTAAMDGAAYSGLLDVVRFLHENRSEGCTAQAMVNAAKNGHLEVIKYLHEHRPDDCTEDVVADAAMNGHLEVVKYLHVSMNQSHTAGVMQFVLLKGNMEMAKYLHEHMGVQFTSFLLSQAEQTRGDPAIIEYVRERVSKDPAVIDCCW